MTDNQPDIAEELEDELLLGKVDSMLRRHRREQFSLMQSAEPVVSEQRDLVGAPSAEAGLVELSREEADDATTEVGGIPVLTEQVMLVMEAWPSQSEISELLYFAFDEALREASINLDPAKRLMLVQALGKRLPKNL
ncbi:hypothetical protein [uncultured Nitrosomonas sp.]|uniref:hypothetical protein n=1 Tax=uncultured Nitrosomonas sp. TaxID=156424 RepID=UPI002620CEE6|nr:hypothetical protein [uncultured Nitrosomonas sp.]